MRLFARFLIAAACMTAIPAHAQVAPQPAAPAANPALQAQPADPATQNLATIQRILGEPIKSEADTPAALRRMIFQGVRLFPLGSMHGLDGYLGMAPNGDFAMFYLAPNGEGLLRGMLYDGEGVNNTQQQMDYLYRLSQLIELGGKMPPPPPKGMTLPPVWQQKFDDASKPAPTPPSAPATPPATAPAPSEPTPAPAAPPTDGAAPIKPQTSLEAPGQPVVTKTAPPLVEHSALANPTTPIQAGETFAVNEPQPPDNFKPAPGVATLFSENVEIPGIAAPAAISVSGDEIPVSDAAIEAAAQAELAAQNAAPAAPADTPDAAAPAEITPAPAGAGQAPDAAQAPAQAQPDAAVLLAAVEKTAWFPVGKAGAPVLYMVVDANCVVCKKALEQLQPLIDDGRLELRIVMGAMLSANSELKAGVILSDPDPARALDLYKGMFSPNPPRSKLTPDGVDKYIRNMKFILDNGVDGTPYFIFPTADGAGIERGLPRDLQGRVIARLKP